MLVKVGQRGQITIPKSIRKALGINPGDNIAISRIDEKIVIRPVTSTIFDLRGTVSVDGKQDFDAILEETRRRVAKQIVES